MDFSRTRGIFVEGIGCVIAGALGTGNGTTSYSENIGAIGITKVWIHAAVKFASRITPQPAETTIPYQFYHLK